ncbi:type II methionyl aminopeptidase [Candidatus Woesearchaeota archaeon]|nr:MAG: type II methionyl aminopeptidase [Candidatus Woesearchaeota archaeon]
MDEETLAKYRQAGKIAAQALAFGAARITPGARVVDVLDEVEEFIREQGADMAFPAQVSINAVAAHFCPKADDMTVFREGDVVKLDVGVHVDGFVGDNAVTIYLGDDAEIDRLVEASRAARDAAIALVRAGVTPHELGAAIEQEITKRGFKPIRNLSGHGVAQYIVHTAPSIPNYPNGDKTPLVAGQTIAIEPFASTGAGRVEQRGENTLYSVPKLRPIRTAAQDVIKRIKSYRGLPFTTRWLTREFGEGKVRLALFSLKHARLLNEYPPLPDAQGGLVSQSEHTLLVTADGCEILTLANTTHST